MRPPTLPLAIISLAAHAQIPINGPMCGPCDMMEATIWMQCQGPCSARLEYWDVNKPDSTLYTSIQDSEADRAHAMDFVMAPLVPGTTYGYRMYVNGSLIDVGQPLTFSTQPLWKFRSDPPAFTVAV